MYQPVKMSIGTSHQELGDEGACPNVVDISSDDPTNDENGTQGIWVQEGSRQVID